MIIKIEAIPTMSEDGKSVLMDKKTNQPVWDKERAFITTKDGRYKRVATLTDEMAAEIAKGNRYFNAMEKDGVLHITGKVKANF